AAEDHRDPLEVAERALDRLERVERGQVILDEPQRALEAAAGVVEPRVIRLAVELGRAVPGVGARRRRRAGRRIARERLEALGGAQEIAGALAQLGELAVRERAEVAGRGVVAEHRLEIDARAVGVAELL